MTTLAVCGDSFFSIDPAQPGASFGEHLCRQNQWELLSLARPGCSNFAICLQVDKAIELGADFVVVGSTSADRMELPIDTKHDSILDEFGEEIYRSKYEKNRGLSNVQYHRHQMHDFDFLHDPTIVSDVIGNILQNHTYRFDITKDQTMALKMYLTYLYDYNLKRQYDSWILSDACRRLLQAEIPFLFFYEHVYNAYSNKPFVREFLKDIDWIPKKYVVDIDEFSFKRDLSHPNKACFHYCEKTGGAIWAKFIQQKYQTIMQKDQS